MKIRHCRVFTSELPFATAAPAIIWQLLFFCLPLAFIFVLSFLQFSKIGEFECITLSRISLLLSLTYFKVIFSSISLAFTNTFFCLLIGFPLAYFMAFVGRKYRNILLFFLIVPFWTNFLLHVYAWFYVLERHGFINSLLMNLHMISEPIQFLNSMPAVFIMMLYYYLPFMVLPIYSSLERFRFNLIEASYDLGASFATTFRRVILPLTSRGIRVGFLLVFIPSFGEFVIPELMGGDKKMFVGTVISQYILCEETESLGTAFTLLSGIILIAITIILYRLLSYLIRPKVSHG
jgi:spermidine/putrescine transport system permease protein